MKNLQLGMAMMRYPMKMQELHSCGNESLPEKEKEILSLEDTMLSNFMHSKNWKICHEKFVTKFLVKLS